MAGPVGGGQSGTRRECADPNRNRPKSVAIYEVRLSERCRLHRLCAPPPLPGRPPRQVNVLAPQPHFPAPILMAKPVEPTKPARPIVVDINVQKLAYCQAEHTTAHFKRHTLAEHLDSESHLTAPFGTCSRRRSA